MLKTTSLAITEMNFLSFIILEKAEFCVNLQNSVISLLGNTPFSRFLIIPNCIMYDVGVRNTPSSNANLLCNWTRLHCRNFWLMYYRDIRENICIEFAFMSSRIIFTFHDVWNSHDSRFPLKKKKQKKENKIIKIYIFPREWISSDDVSK